MARPACVFCEIVEKRAPSSVVHEDDQVLAILDIFPVRTGHTLVMPRRHVTLLEDLTEEEHERVFRVGRRVLRALSELGLSPASNFLVNNGRAAGQTVPHVHLHVVPRVRLDFAEVKLITRVMGLPGARTAHASLDEVARRIREVMSRGAAATS